MKIITSIGVIDGSKKVQREFALLYLKHKLSEEREIYELLTEMGLQEQADTRLAIIDNLVLEIESLEDPQ